MKPTAKAKQDTCSATIAQSLWLVLACSGLFVLTAFASDPSWWSLPENGTQPAVMMPQVVTNAATGIVSTNYVTNPYAVVTQGQLKQFTARAVDELNANLPNGAGSNLNYLVQGWAQDYATNNYSSTNNPYAPYKPSDFTVMNIGQLKYIGNQVWSQLVAGSFTNAVPSWLTSTNAGDLAAANLSQLKEVFNFDLIGYQNTISNVTATLNSDGSVTLNWSLPSGGNNNPIVIGGENLTGQWTTIATLGISATSDTLSSSQISQFTTLGVSNALIDALTSLALGAVNNPNGPPPIPLPPTELTGSVDSSYNMNLSWSASTGATNYLVEREQLSTGIWSTLGTTSVITYQDPGYGNGGYHYRVSGINSTGTSTPSTEFPISRYAVIDLGANLVPTKLTNSGQVLLQDVATGTLFYRWNNGVPTQLQMANTNDYSMAAFDIGEDGTAVGYENVPVTDSYTPIVPAPDDSSYTPPTLIINAYANAVAKWSPGNSVPAITLGTNYSGQYIPYIGYNAQMYADDVGLAYISNTSTLIDWKSLPGYNWNEVYLDSGSQFFYSLNNVFSNGVDDQPGPSGNYSSYIASNNSGDVITGIWGAFQVNSNPLFFSPSAISNRMTTSGTTSFYIGGMDSNYNLICYNSSTDIFQIVAPFYGPFGSEPFCINAATIAFNNGNGTTSIMPAVQIYRGTGLYEMNAATGNFNPALNLNDLISPNSSWSYINLPSYYETNNQNALFGKAHNHGSLINDSGAIVGTATYTGTNYPTGSHGVLLLPIAVTPQTIPTSGVARASLTFGSGVTVPTIDPENPPTITVGGQPATCVRQDDLDPHILYFTVPSGTAGPADVTISGISVPGMPWLSATPPQTMTLPNFVQYTDDSVKGINGFSDSIGVSMSEAKSKATKQEQIDGLTGQPEAENYEDPLDFAFNTQIGLINDFMDGRSVDTSVESAFSNLRATNLAREQANLTTFGISYSGGVTVPVPTFSIAATTSLTQYGGAAGVFTITRTAEYNTDVTVHYAITGTAVNGTDYSTLSGSIVMPAHNATETINVIPLSALTANKTVTVTLSTNSAYQIINPNAGTVTISAGHAGLLPQKKSFVQQGEFRLPMSLRETLAMMAFTAVSTPTNPQLGAPTFYADVKAWMTTNSKTVFFGNDGPTVFEVMNADNFALNTYYPAAAGETVDNAITANPGCEVVLNGAFFGRIPREAMVTTGVVIKNGAIVTSVSAAPGSTSYTKLAAKRYWFGQMNDSSATRNAGHALSYVFGGKGNPVGGSGPTDLKAAIGGLVSLIWPNTSGIPQKQTVNVGDPTYDADLSVYTTRHAGFLNGFGIIGVNRANGLIIVMGKKEWSNQYIFTIQDDLFASGTDQAIANDGGGSTAFYGKTGGISLKAWRHLPGTTAAVTPTVPARETVSNYFIFTPQ